MFWYNTLGWWLRNDQHSSRFTWRHRCSVSNIRWIVFLNHHVRKHESNAWNYLFSHNFSESPINYHIKRTKTLVEAYARCITENITKRWLRQTLVVERGIAVSYKYNPLASVPVPEICVPVLCSRAQKVAVIVIKRKCRLIPDLPAPVAQLFVRWGSVDFMTNRNVICSLVWWIFQWKVCLTS